MAEAVAAATDVIHRERREMWARPVFGRDEIAFIYNLKPCMTYTDPVLRAFRDVTRPAYPNEPPPYRLFAKLLIDAYGEEEHVHEGLRVKLHNYRDHEPFVAEFGEALASIRRNAWRGDRFDRTDFATLYGSMASWRPHLVLAVHAGLRQFFEDDPPPEKVFDHCYESVYSAVMQDDSPPPSHIDPEYAGHEPYMPAVFEAADRIRRAMWARDDLTDDDYCDLFAFDDDEDGGLFHVVRRVHRAFKATTHPVDPPLTDDFYEACDAVHELPCFS